MLAVTFDDGGELLRKLLETAPNRMSPLVRSYCRYTSMSNRLTGLDAVMRKKQPSDSQRLYLFLTISEVDGFGCSNERKQPSGSQRLSLFLRMFTV